MRRLRCVLRTAYCVIAFAALPAGAQQVADPYAEVATLRASAGDSAAFGRLLELNWNWQLAEFPEFATYVGHPGSDDRWTDISPAAIERRKQVERAALAAANLIDRSRLSPRSRLDYDLFRKSLLESVEGQRFPGELIQITQRGGIHQELVSLLAQSPARTARDYENMIARLAAAPVVVDQTIALLRRGLERGVTPPRVTLRDVGTQIPALLTTDPLDSPILRPFREFTPSIAAPDRDGLRAAAARTFQERTRPALERLQEFLVSTYIPRTRETIAAAALPDGPAWYAYNTRVMTTTRMTPARIHELGVAEVRRIRAVMDSLIASTGFRGSFPEFLTFLRTDSQFFYADSASLVRAYRDIAKRIDPGLVRLFRKIPRLPYGVTTIPSFSAPSTTTAYYSPGSPEAGRPGYYYVNTYDLRARPKWEMEALSLHEAVPGHHFQIALAQEMENVPVFRRHTGYTAFVEGWALYAESLGPELGMYRDPYSKFGQLTYEMWRAVRLVVDTGIHSMGWSRDRAIQYFRENAAKTERDIVQEIDRYIVWPGQALAYKIGELKIKELRREAETALGARFDVREFHDKVLENGAVPLDVLETTIREWIQAKRGG